VRHTVHMCRPTQGCASLCAVRETLSPVSPVETRALSLAAITGWWEGELKTDEDAILPARLRHARQPQKFCMDDDRHHAEVPDRSGFAPGLSHSPQSALRGLATVFHALALSARRPCSLFAWRAAELARAGYFPVARAHVRRPAVPAARQTGRRCVSKAGSRAPAALPQQLAECEEVTETAEKLNHGALTARDLVQGSHFAEARTKPLLQEVLNRSCPRQEHRTSTVIDSAPSAGARRPFHPKGRS
jgi:hypothetical protein